MRAIPFFHKPNSGAADDANNTDTLQKQIAALSEKIDTLSLEITCRTLQAKFMQEPLKTTSATQSESARFKTICPLDSPFKIEIVFFSLFVEAFNAYIKARSNGEDEDLPKYPFPSGGFEQLEGDHYTLKYYKNIYEQNCLEANARRYPHDKKKFGVSVTHLAEDKKQFTFSTHNANGETIQIQGFCWVADKEKGFPDKQGNYWGYIEYNDEKDENIRNWMKEKDANYMARCQAFFEETEKLEQNILQLEKEREALSELLKAQPEQEEVGNNNHFTAY